MTELKLTPAQAVKARQMCEQAKGMRIDVRTDPKTKYTGIVDVCEPSHWGYSQLVFRVELLCGAAQARKEFFISTFNSAR